MKSCKDRFTKSPEPRVRHAYIWMDDVEADTDALFAKMAAGAAAKKTAACCSNELLK